MLEALSALVQIATVALSAVAIWTSLRANREALEMLVFSEYTKRHADVSRSWAAAQDAAARRAAACGFFDLWSEEFWLHRSGRVPSDVWSLWQDGIVQCLADAQVRECWAGARSGYVGQGDFVAWVDVLVAQAQVGASTGGQRSIYLR